MTIIPAGYRITVDSWENDGDNSKTEVVEGIETRELAQFYVDMCLLLEGEYGNMFEPSEVQMAHFGEAAMAVFRRHVPLPEGYEDVPEADASTAAEAARELLIDFFGGSEFYTRVLSKLRVEHIPEPVELKDVTKEFVVPSTQD